MTPIYAYSEQTHMTVVTYIALSKVNCELFGTKCVTVDIGIIH